MKKDKELKILLLKSQYLTEEYETIKEEMDIYRANFYKEFPEEYERMLKANEATQGENSQTVEEEIEEEEDSESSVPKSKTLKTLYRRISKITHPDKVESEFLTSYFKKATTAYSENNIAELFQIGSTLNIDTSDLDMDSLPDELKNSISTKSFQIFSIKNSLAWQWAHAETEEQKEKLRKILKEHADKYY